MDAGATWFRDYTWAINGVSIDLGKYDITAYFMDSKGNDVLGPYTEGDGVMEGADVGRLEIRVPATDNSVFLFETSVRLRVDMTATADDALTGYKEGETVALISSTIPVYPRHAGK